jgi:hypothetical protein
MTFARRDIYIRDILKVVDLASSDQRLQRRLADLHVVSFPKSWAVDGRGHFMLLLPSVTREDSAHRHYFFFYDGRFIEARGIEFFGHKVSFHKFPSELENRRSEVQAAFSAAARVHGTFGNGPNGFGKSLDTQVRDDSVDKFEPEFVQDDVKAPDR